MLIPAWLVCLFAILDAVALYKTAPMARGMRIALVIPRVVFALSYSYFCFVDTSVEVRAEIIRDSILALFVIEFVTSLVWALKKNIVEVGERLHGNIRS